MEVEILWFALVGVVEIVFEYFCEYHEVFAVVEEVVHVDEAGLVGAAVGLDVLQQFDLVEGLVHVVFVIQDHLYRVSLLLVGGSQVFHLNRL